jgi:hypothetical protein
MTAENWGGLRADSARRALDTDSESSAPDRPDDAGAWPDEMDEIRFYADSALTIPGEGEPPSECGVWRYREFCDNCGEPIPAPHACQQRRCPNCWLTWRGNRAVAITERLAAGRRDADGADARLVHCVASPPPGSFTTLHDYWSGFNEAYALAEEKGIHGGVVVPHGWRVKDWVKEAYRELSDANVISEWGVWEFVREHKKDWRTLTYWSPHFHILGLGAEIGPNKPAEQDGWVWNRISHRGESSLPRFNLTDADTYEPMFAAAMYVLGHIGFESEGQQQAVRWFGSLAYNKFGGLDELADWEESTIERNVAEIAGREVEDDDGDGAGESLDDCPKNDCDGSLRPIWRAGRWLSDPDWCDAIGREQQRRLGLALDWACGEVVPPPGLQRPQSREDLEESFEVMYERW